MKKPIAGLLPFYLKMHDDAFPERRPVAEAWLVRVTEALEQAGLDIVRAPICRLKAEFDAAAALLSNAAPDAVITLHIVYSPSLESIDALSSLSAPIIVMDTTPDWDFGERAAPYKVRPNIGIHGVQDMCSLLTRHGIFYEIAAGHIDHSDIVQRIAQLVRAAMAARVLKSGRVGRIGGVYPGMGDFNISNERIKSELGATVVEADFTRERFEIAESDVDAELALDRERYDIFCAEDKDFRESERANLMVRAWLVRHGLDAFTANFMGITKACGLPRMPFIEASRAMERGTGYAGEGDTLTSLLMAGLLRICPQSCFTEMFCPGWSDDTIFLSHMGEISPALCAARPQIHKMNMLFSDTGDVACLYGALRPGAAVLVNLTPLAQGFRLILSPVDVAQKPLAPGFERMVTGFIRPCLPVSDFLETFSRLGGTHHSVLCYGADMRTLRAFGRMMGFEVYEI